MSQGIPSVLVASKCVEWYSCIIQNDLEEATRLQQDVTEMIKDMEPDDKVIAYFNLLSFRYKMLLQQPTTEITPLPSESDSEPFLKYMYYFISGQREFYEGRYTSAVRLYNKAEKLLDSVGDRYERAEFLFRLADGYYRISQYTFSIAYMEQAMQLFEQDSSYEHKVLNGHLLLAAIDSELGQYERAECRYFKTLDKAAVIPELKALILRSLGMNRVRQGKYEEAKSFFVQALEIKEHETTRVGNKTKADLAFSYLRLGNVEVATTLLREIEEWTQQDNEYHAKTLIYLNVYIDAKEKGIKRGFDELIQHELYFDAEEIAVELVKYYEDREQYFDALHYAKLALNMNAKNQLIGSVEIENPK